MRAFSQRPAGLLDSNHPSVEVNTPSSAVASDTGFASWKVSNVL